MATASGGELVPAYPGLPGATAPVQSNLSSIGLQKGESCYVWGKLAAGATQLPVTDINVAAETILAGGVSLAINLSPSETNSPPMVCVEIHFSGAPGVFEIDVQEADTDADAFYILMSNANYTINTVNATTQNVRVDLSPTGGKFMRLFMKTLPNAVNVWAKITRLA